MTKLKPLTLKQLPVSTVTMSLIHAHTINVVLPKMSCLAAFNF